MKRAAILALCATLAVGAILLLSGCESSGGEKMSMTSSSGEHQMTCQACYDEVKMVRKNMVKGTAYQVIRKHKCSACNAEAILYGQDGVPMFKCAGCTPDGVPCDKCLPPRMKS